MNSTSKYWNTSYGAIGINPIALEPTANDNDKRMQMYAKFDIKRLTKANSFLIMDEVFYIAKKDCNGKASKIYFVYRVSDKRLIAAVPKSKEDTINLIKRKYYEYA